MFAKSDELKELLNGDGRGGGGGGGGGEGFSVPSVSNLEGEFDTTRL